MLREATVERQAVMKSYEPSRHLISFHVAGFQHWDGATVLSKLSPGCQLDLVPEFDNPHDPEAIALYIDGVKIGYVPADKNGLISTLAFFGHTGVFECRVLQVAPEKDPWEQVRVGIYVVDAR